MSGWVVEGDHVRLRDDSCVKIVSQLLGSFLPSSATGVVPFPDDEFQVLIKALYNGNIACVQKLLKVPHLSHDGRIYSESRSSINVVYAATTAQQIDVVKLLLTDYHLNPAYFIAYISGCTPQSFVIEIMKYCSIKANLKSTEGFSLLHIAVMEHCFDIVSFLLEECSGTDVNVTVDESLRTPLHIAYLCGHTKIAEYLIHHGANVYAMDINGCTPYKYINGDSNFIKVSEYAQNKRIIHHFPYSVEHCYYMNLVNLGIDDMKAVSLTMEQFPSLKKDGPTRPHHDIDHASALKEFTQFITKRPTDEPWIQRLSHRHILFN